MSKGREKKPQLRGKQELDATQRKEIDEAFSVNCRVALLIFCLPV